ncbi:hypothetical protein BC629DRAFT_1538024 [Irpex lacteus]|nr:hypothetical protein BC629DRAFT_1538024 [Irpex lacteus]
MHAISHSFAHRGPGASRARTRWQPYTSNNLNSATPPALSRSPQTYLNTPNSTVLPSTSTYISPAVLHSAPSLPSITPAKPTPAAGGPLREHKYKYVSGLVDQAVKSLCDIWQPEDIPAVFCTKATSSSDSSTSGHALFDVPFVQPPVRNVQLPSPISPTTQPSPISTSPISPTAQIAAASCRTSQVVPIRGFVHEVLRRSRTSTSVLQTALCYLEAVRIKVPELIAREKNKVDYPEDVQDAAEEERIIMGDIDEENARLAGLCEDMDQSLASDYAPTIRVELQEPLTAPPTELLTSMDVNEPLAPPPATSSASSKQASPSLPPLPALPSPLLCPRRTFLACLILASKFLQDRSYSNKAWAKLAGLPPREIGRCERAVGEALEWRLWVGKVPATSSTPVGTHRAVARCRSEATLQLPTCNWAPAPAPAAPFAARPPAVRSTSQSTVSGLRRSVTVPEIGSAARGPYSETWLAPSGVVATGLFSAEPDMDVSPSTQFTAQASGNMDCTFSQSNAFFAAYFPSPPVSTPSLAYSPMSTASTTSSDDGERTVQFPNFVDAPPQAGHPGKFSGNITGPTSGYSHPLERSYTHGQLSAFNPLVAKGPAHLPPLYESVSHSVMLESTMNGAHVADVSLSAYNTFGNWSVSS